MTETADGCDGELSLAVAGSIRLLWTTVGKVEVADMARKCTCSSAQPSEDD